MIADIVSHTPLWVWPLLVFLLYRGWRASFDRDMSLIKTLALPVVMFGLSVSGLLLSVGTQPGHALLGMVTLLAVAVLRFKYSASDAIRVNTVNRHIVERGSWVPLWLTSGLFVTKYSAAVLLARHPQLAVDPGFALPLAGVYGAFAGVFAGRLLRILHLYRSALAAAG